MNNTIYLAHHGIKGQKWYVRRYQNEDGTLTQEGRKRYYDKYGTLKKEKLTKDVIYSLNAAEQYRAEHKIKKDKYTEGISMHTRDNLDKEIERYTKDAKELLKLAAKEGIEIKTYDNYVRTGTSGSEELLKGVINLSSALVLGPIGLAVSIPLTELIRSETNSRAYTRKG